MRERGKAVTARNSSSSSNHCSDLACRRHPASCSSSAGICAYCLQERLVRLVCPECGEQRLSSSCSCSDFSTSRRNSSCTLDLGSTARASFLIDSDNPGYHDLLSNPIALQEEYHQQEAAAAEIEGEEIEEEQQQEEEEEERAPDWLRRSSSGTTTADPKRRNAGKFWRKIFGKKKDTSTARKYNPELAGGSRNEMWAIPDGGGGGGSSSILKSRSLRGRSFSFRSGDTYPGGDLGQFLNVSAAAARNSSSGATSGANRRVFSLKETDFSDSSSYIDLKLGMGGGPSAPKSNKAMARSNSSSVLSDRARRGGRLFDGRDGGSFRMPTADQSSERKSRKSSASNVWKWMFRGSLKEDGPNYI